MPPDWLGRFMFLWSVGDVVGIFIYGAYVACASCGDEREQGQQERHEQAHLGRDHDYPPSGHGESGVVEPPGVEPSAADEQKNFERQHRLAEQRYWKRQVRQACWQNLLTGAAAAVGIGGLIALYGTLYVTSGQLNAQLTAQRPWIVLDDIKAIPPPSPSPSASPTGAKETMRFDVTVKNVGQGPAFTVRFPVVCSMGPKLPDEEIDRLPVIADAVLSTARFTWTAMGQGIAHTKDVRAVLNGRDDR